VIYWLKVKKQLKSVVAMVIVAGTIAAFGYYLARHPQTVTQLRQVPIGILILLVGLYLVAFGAYVLITRGSLRLYHKSMPLQENILFNAYSSIVNFFGPGQSGPVFRGAYLKKRHNLSVKQYLFTMLVYYGFFGVISALCMVVGSRPWWQTLLLTAVLSAASFGIIRRYKRRRGIDTQGGLTPANLAWIFGATVLQVAVLAVIYGLELRHVGGHISAGQVLAYTGVANFALFVSITPGAIGIREGFLAFSHDLHHLSNGTIVAANVVDRAVYLVLLGLLFVLVVTLHAKDKLHVRQLRGNKPE